MSLSLIVSLVYQDREPTKSAQAVCVQTVFKTPINFATFAEVSAVAESSDATRALLSRPTSPRSTPITTTGIRFMVSVDAEGGMDIRLTG